MIVPASLKQDQERLLGIALDAIAATGFDMVNQLCEVHADGDVVFSAWPFEPNLWSRFEEEPVRFIRLDRLSQFW